MTFAFTVELLPAAKLIAALAGLSLTVWAIAKSALLFGLVAQWAAQINGTPERPGYDGLLAYATAAALETAWNECGNDDDKRNFDALITQLRLMGFEGEERWDQIYDFLDEYRTNLLVLIKESA